MKKMKPYQVNKAVFIVAISGFAVALFGIAIESMVLCGIGMIAMVGMMIFRVIFYRCPHCNAYLDRSTGDYCPYCGENVNK